MRFIHRLGLFAATFTASALLSLPAFAGPTLQVKGVNPGAGFNASKAKFDPAALKKQNGAFGGIAPVNGGQFALKVPPKPVQSAPELDPSGAAAVGMILLGAGAILVERRRRLA